jgi:hypothetical protein
MTPVIIITKRRPWNIINGIKPNAKAKYKLKILEKEIYATRAQLSTYTTVFE